MPTKQELEDYIKELSKENSELRKSLDEPGSPNIPKRIKELEAMPLKESELTLLRQYYKRQME